MRKLRTLGYGAGEGDSVPIDSVGMDGISDGMPMLGVGTVTSGDAPPSVGVQAAIAALMARTASSRFSLSSSFGSTW